MPNSSAAHNTLRTLNELARPRTRSAPGGEVFGMAVTSGLRRIGRTNIGRHPARALQIQKPSCFMNVVYESRSAEAADVRGRRPSRRRSEEHTSELQSLMRISYAVFCLKKKHPLTILTI